ncbi:MAG: Gldg family protein [Woeseiaceae bacterium]|nr:Gldg family protein [Woeseiaceae bacterium]
MQPKDLDEKTLYAIDQYLLDGGKALIFVDPVADADPATPPSGMPAGMPLQGQSSDLPELFSAWGINFSTSDVVADAQLALQLSGGPGRRPIRHLAFLGVTVEQLNTEDVTTADLGSLNLATAGYLQAADDSALTFEPLISSSPAASTVGATRFSYLPDPSVLQDGFEPRGEPFVLAARISGVLKSAFPEWQATERQ